MTGFLFGGGGGAAATVFNVKTYGATGLGSVDDASSIQAAVNACRTAGGGKVYFPIGEYKILSTINFYIDGANNWSIIFCGDGLGSYLHGNCSGFVLDRYPPFPDATAPDPNAPGYNANNRVEFLKITNDYATGGCVRMCAATTSVVQSCDIQGYNGVHFASGNTINDVAFSSKVDSCNISGIGSPITADITASIATGPGVPTMTVTALNAIVGAAAFPLAAGQVLDSHAATFVQGTTIVSQLASTESGGTLGGRGTYQVSASQTVASDWIKVPNPITYGGVGVMLGPETNVNNCGITTFYEGIQVYGAGESITNCRIEVNFHGIHLGRYISGSTRAALGVHISGTSVEANVDGIYVDSATNVLINSLTFDCSQNHGSRSAVRLFGGADIVLINLAGGNYTSVASFWVQGNMGGSVTFIGCEGGYSLNSAANMFPVEFINCKGMSNPVITWTQLNAFSTHWERGMRRWVSDPNTASWGVAITTSGASGTVEAVYNGSAWTVAAK